LQNLGRKTPQERSKKRWTKKKLCHKKEGGGGPRNVKIGEKSPRQGWIKGLVVKKRIKKEDKRENKN